MKAVSYFSENYNQKLMEVYMTLLLTDDEAMDLIKIIKNIVEKHVGVLKYPTEGEIKIRSTYSPERDFKLIYRLMHEEKKVYQFFDTHTGHTLLRININNGFHLNADKEKIEGPRINLFSEEEYYLKNDQKTHTRAYKLPVEGFENFNDVVLLLDSILEYINVNNKEFVQISLQSSLDI